MFIFQMIQNQSVQTRRLGLRGTKSRKIRSQAVLNKAGVTCTVYNQEGVHCKL